MSKLSVVFFGSGPVASESLAKIASSFEIEAIITKPSTAALMQQQFPHIPLFTADNRNSLDSLIQATSFRSKVAILVDFGIIVSRSVINAFPCGIVNSHFSLLPKLRGADPITFAILTGENKTGVSLMLLVEKMDEGPLLAQASLRISPGATTETLTHDLIKLSATLLADTLPKYIENGLEPSPQRTDEAPTYTRKLTKEDGLIDWSKPAAQIEREIRAYLTWPKSYTTIANREIVILSARVVAANGKPGVIIHDKKQLVVCCGDKGLEILELKPAGKPAMNIAAFLAGYGKYL